MTPKEKAKELFDSYYYCLLQSDVTQRTYWSKQCALIAVDEIIKSWNEDLYEDCGASEYWKEVEIEINNI